MVCTEEEEKKPLEIEDFKLLIYFHLPLFSESHGIDHTTETQQSRNSKFHYHI